MVSFWEKHLVCLAVFLIIDHGGEIEEAFYPGNMFSFEMCNAKYIFRESKKVSLKAPEGVFCLVVVSRFLYRWTKFHRKFGRPCNIAENAQVLVPDKFSLNSSFTTYQLCAFTPII